MISLRLPLVATLVLVIHLPLLPGARAAEFYISPTGSNSNNGLTLDTALGTFDFAIDRLSPGDTLLVGGGTYQLSSRIRLQGGDGGIQNNPVKIWAVPGASPVLDFTNMTAGWGSSSGRGIQIDNGVDWLHFRGLTIQNARDNGLYSESDHSIFEMMTTRYNGDSGIQLDGPSAHNLILNSDSYHNYDPSNNGENADGFAIKFSQIGPGNVVRGSRAWGNSDDGWDMWQSTTGGVLVEDSWAFDNGQLIQQFFDKDALELGDLTAGNFNGDGNGYKLGQDGGPHTLNRVLAWENAVRGIDVNGNGFGVTVNNSTVYNSGRNWQFDETAAETTNQHILRNNISVAGTQSDNFDTGVTHSFNSWNGPVTATLHDFLSLDDTIARGPRQADGSLPISDFLRLAPGSDLIDAGTDVGLPFSGPAPDLGAYETEALSFAAADFNEDGDVDGADLAIWESQFGLASGATHRMGDADSNGTVDGGDWLVWQRQFEGGAAGVPIPGVAIPEPFGGVLSLAGLLVGVTRRRRAEGDCCAGDCCARELEAVSSS
jgi:hypothetical protein